MTAPGTTSSPPASDVLAHLLKAAGDPLRLEILRALAQDSFGVLELCQLFDIKQSGMSHHLKVLANAGLVNTRKEGNSIFYRRAPVHGEGGFSALRNEIFRASDSLTLSQDVDRNLDAVYQQRAEASRNFFSNNAARFRAQQDLIAAYDVYGSHVAEALRRAPLASREVALEIGPGAGEFLLSLCREFTHCTALDNSEQMLRQSRQRCLEHGYHNIDFVHDDTHYCQQLAGRVDCAVINMVLHHTPSPQQIFDDVATALKAGGVVIVCDLCAHNQDWTREACGDIWLGFAGEDLSAWAERAGLLGAESSYFALRNGFQIQLHTFVKQGLSDNVAG